MTLADEPQLSGADLLARFRAQPGGAGAPVADALSPGADLLARYRRRDQPNITFEELGYDLLGQPEFDEANRAVAEDRGFFSSAFRGLAETLGGENTPFGVGSARTAQRIARYAYLDNKLRRGEATRDEQLEHLERFTEYSRQPGIREMAGDIVGALPSFGVEVAASAGIGAAALKSGTRGVRIAAARVAREEAATAATRAMALRVSGAAKAIGKSAVAKAGAGVAAGTAVVEAVPNLFGMGGGRWTSYALQKAMPQLLDMDPEDWEALEGLSNAALVDMLSADLPVWQGALDTAIEFGSEFAGAGIGKALGATVAGSYVLTLQKRVLDKIAGSVGNRGADLLDDLAKRTRYDGPIVEMLEERLGDAARVATGLEDLDQLMPELDELAAEALALSFPALGGAALRRAVKLSRGDMAAEDRDFGGAQVMEPDAEIETSALARLERAGVKNPRVFRPEAGSQENLAERWAAMTGRRLLVVEADSFETPAGAMGGVTFAPDLIVASRAEARPWRLAAHELRHTVQGVSTPAERQAQRAAIDAIDPELIARAYKEWQGAVAEGGAGTAIPVGLLGLETFEGEATLSEWVAPLMAYAARNADGRRAVERLAARDTTGFWSKVWQALKDLLGAFTREGRADLGARAAAAHVPSSAQLTAQQSAEVALLLEDWIEGSAERVARWAGSPTAKATRDGSGVPVSERISRPNSSTETPGAGAGEAVPSVTEVQPAVSAASAGKSVPRGTGENKPAGTKEERDAEKAARELQRKLAAVPMPGDVVQVTSVGNQGLADVLETIGNGPEVRLRVRLRADHQGEQGGRARTGNRKNRTIEVHRSEVRMHERRAAEGERGVRQKVREERDAVTARLVASAKRPITLADPVSVWGKKARKGRKASGARSAASEPEDDADVADEAEEADGAQPGASPGAPKLTAAERRAARAAAEPEVQEPAEPTDPDLGHQTDPPALKPAEEALAQKIAQKLLSVVKLQTRYMGNKARYLRNEAWNLARLLATAQDAETVFDWYAGGGSYALSVVASGALPAAKRIVINEFDPVRRLRLEAALSEGGAFMDEWTSNPFLVELRGHLDKLRGSNRSASVFGPAIETMTSPEKKGAAAHAWFKKASAQYAQLSPRAKAAIIAFADMADGSYRADTDKLLEMAREDGQRVQQLAAAVRARGIVVDVVSMDAVGEEAVALVQAAGKGSVVFADPPYHETSTGTYSGPDGFTLKMNSDQALAMYVHGVARMAIGNVAVYHNNATAKARDTVYHALGGFVHLRTWERIPSRTKKNGKVTEPEWEVVGYAYGREFDGQSRARAGSAAQFPLADAAGGAGGGAVLGGAGGGQPGDADAAAARGAGSGGNASGRGDFEPWFEPVGTIDWMVDALAGAGARRPAVAGMLAAQSVQGEALVGWDPFEGSGLPPGIQGGPLADQSLLERLAARTASQRKQRPITLVDHILSYGGIDLRGIGRRNEGGDIEDAILGSALSNRSGIPAGLLYREDSKSKSGGLRPDDLRERLKEDGFTSSESDGRITFDDLMEGIANELGGGMPMVAPGNEGLLYAEDARLQALREQEDLLGATPDDVANVGLFVDDPNRQPWDLPFAPSRKVDVDGVKRPAMNSAGRPIHSTKEGIQNFWRWFGDSKTVDAEGRPIVMYHGTRTAFESFDTKRWGDVFGNDGDFGQGAYFTSDPAAASRYAGSMGSKAVDGANVIASYVRITNPLVLDFREGGSGFGALKEKVGISFQGLELRGDRGRQIRRAALVAGLDGVFVHSHALTGVDKETGRPIVSPQEFSEVVTFNSTQIKSATGNRGTFGQGVELLAFAPAKRTRVPGFGEWQEEFKVGPNKYRVFVHPMEDDAGDLVLDVAFERDRKPGDPSRYGDNHDEPRVAQVFATVLASVTDGIRHIARSYDPSAVDYDTTVHVYFSAATEQRARIYERLAARMAQRAGGTVERHGDGDDGTGFELIVEAPLASISEAFAPSRMKRDASRVYRTLRGMLVSDVQDVELVQAEIEERVGITAATDFVGAIDLARSRGPANVQGLIHRLVGAVAQLRGKASMEDLNRIVYAKTAPARNAWLKVALADRYMRQRLGVIEQRIKRYGKILSPQQLGRLQGEVNAIDQVRQLDGAERLAYARRRGVKISDSPAGIDDLTAAAELSRLRKRLGEARADQLLDFIREENWAALERAVASGILTPAKAQEWHAREPYYVSLKDIDEDLDAAAGFSRPARSLAVRGPLWKAAQGRDEEAERSLEAWLEDKLRRYEHIARNEALQVGAAMARSDPKSGLTVLQRNPRGDEVERAVAFFENGQQAWLVFPTPAAALALKGLHGQQVGEILGMIGIGTRFFSRMVTSRNPAFWLPNFLRDTAQAMWTLTAERGLGEGFEVLAGAWKVLPQVVMHSLGKKTALSPIIDQAILDGIKTTWVGVHTLQERLQEMHDALAPKTGPGVFVRSGLRTFDAISDAFEVATRLSMYQHDLARGKTRREAALAAKNITVNFDKKGTLTPSLSALYSFFNPAVQGARRIIEAATETKQGLQVTAATVTIGLLWEMLAYALSDDDEETGLSVYGQLASWSKDRNLHMPFAVGGVYATYPMPYGVSSIFGFGRYMAHLLFDDLDPRVTRATAVQSAFWNVINEFQPMGDVRSPYVALTPTIAKPLTELKENRKFGGRPIMRDKVQFGTELPDSARAHSTINDRASGWLGQKIAHALNLGGPEDLETGLDVSPATVQHLIQWIGSGFGLRELDRISQFAMSSREVPALANTPFLRNFTNSVSSHATSESYYDLRDRAERVWRRAKDARGAPRERALALDPELYQLAPAFDSTDRQLRVLQQRMDGASREQSIDLQERRLELQARMVRQYYGARR